MKFNPDKMLFIDVDTIKEFMVRGFKLYKPVVEGIKINLYSLTHIALKHDISILSLCDKHYGDDAHSKAEVELIRNGGPFDLHAEIGSEAAEKISETLLENDVVFIPTDLKINVEKLNKMVHDAKQIIIEKQAISAQYHHTTNLGGNPVYNRILDMFESDIDVFVYGVYTEYCIKENAIPFLLKGLRVWIVKDAIAPFNINPDDGDNALADLANMGVRFITTDDLIELLEQS